MSKDTLSSRPIWAQSAIERSATERDGNPMTGLESETALDGSHTNEAALEALFDGNPSTRDPLELDPNSTGLKDRLDARDGNVHTGLLHETSLDGSAVNEVERVLSRDGNPRNDLEQRNMPTPWIKPMPTPKGYEQT